MKSVVKFFAFLLFKAIDLGIQAFTVEQLWKWFVVPSFGLKELTSTASLGLVMLLTILTFNLTGQQIVKELEDSPSREDDDFRIVGYRIGCWTSALAAGWVLTFF